MKCPYLSLSRTFHLFFFIRRMFLHLFVSRNSHFFCGRSNLNFSNELPAKTFSPSFIELEYKLYMLRSEHYFFELICTYHIYSTKHIVTSLIGIRLRLLLSCCCDGLLAHQTSSLEKCVLCVIFSKNLPKIFT